MFFYAWRCYFRLRCVRNPFCSLWLNVGQNEVIPELFVAEKDFRFGQLFNSLCFHVIGLFELEHRTNIRLSLDLENSDPLEEFSKDLYDPREYVEGCLPLLFYF